MDCRACEGYADIVGRLCSLPFFRDCPLSMLIFLYRQIFDLLPTKQSNLKTLETLKITGYTALYRMPFLFINSN